MALGIDHVFWVRKFNSIEQTKNIFGILYKNTYLCVAIGLHVHLTQVVECKKDMGLKLLDMRIDQLC